MMRNDYAIAILKNDEEEYLVAIKENKHYYTDDLEDALLFNYASDMPQLQDNEYIVEVGGTFEYGSRTRYVRDKVNINQLQ